MKTPPIGILITFIVSLFPANLAAVDLEGLIGDIRERQAPFFEKYAGYQSLHTSTTVIRDAKNGEVKDRIETTLVVRQYFGEGKPEVVRVIRYVKNGKVMSPDDYKEHPGDDAMYAIFGRNSDTHYRFQYEGEKTIQGHECHVIRVIPRKKTNRHFSGLVYMRKKDLAMVMMRGTKADLPASTRSLNINVMLGPTSAGVRLPVSTNVRFQVHVPIFFPNRAFLIRTRMTDHRLISR
jgi:hypothetical protein